MNTQTKKKPKIGVREQKRILNCLYDELTPYTNHPRINIGHKTLLRIEDKVFKEKTVRDILTSCKWFLEHYPEGYTCDIIHIDVRVRLSVRHGGDEYRFVDYYISGKKNYVYENDVKIFQNYFVNNGIYDPAIHYVVDVPQK